MNCAHLFQSMFTTPAKPNSSDRRGQQGQADDRRFFHGTVVAGSTAHSQLLETAQGIHAAVRQSLPPPPDRTVLTVQHAVSVLKFTDGPARAPQHDRCTYGKHLKSIPRLLMDARPTKSDAGDNPPSHNAKATDCKAPGRLPDHHFTTHCSFRRRGPWITYINAWSAWSAGLVLEVV
jgi:hypothetical protein